MRVGVCVIPLYICACGRVFSANSLCVTENVDMFTLCVHVWVLWALHCVCNVLGYHTTSLLQHSARDSAQTTTSPNCWGKSHPRWSNSVSRLCVCVSVCVSVCRLFLISASVVWDERSYSRLHESLLHCCVSLVHGKRLRGKYSLDVLRVSALARVLHVHVFMWVGMWTR